MTRLVDRKQERALLSLSVARTVFVERAARCAIVFVVVSSLGAARAVMENPSAIAMNMVRPPFSELHARQGIPFGPYHLPDAEFRAPFTGSPRGVSTAEEAVAALETARGAGFRLVLRLARGSRRFENPGGSFSLEMWKREIDRYRAIDFESYVRDGTLLGHLLFDEPHDPTNWDGKPVPYADIVAAAAYSKELWPTLPTGVGSPPTALQQLRGDSPRGALDFALAQYRPAKGEVTQWLNREAALARRLGYGLALSMNALDGNGTNKPLTGAQLRQYGSVLAREPSACLLTMWKYDKTNPEYFERRDVIAALHDVARVAAERAARPCLAEQKATSQQFGQTPRRSAGSSEEVVLVGAGDIADCDEEGEHATARLLDGIEGVVFTLGDHAYPDGTVSEFSRCYAPTWGRHKARTRPAPGNHDYHLVHGIPYHEYFGAASGTAGKGYYSYDAGAWHVIVLNTSIPINSSSPQIQWLRSDLAQHAGSACTLAYFHRARFSSGRHGSSTTPLAAWRVLYEAGADVVLSAHDHVYERFAPQTPDGSADTVRGIRQFTVGTGGAGLSELGTLQPNSEVLDNTHFGVLKLSLGPTGYRWHFLNAADGATLDSGSAACH
jgi:hypothetical protein